MAANNGGSNGAKRKMPVGKPWAKGVSGNPKGAPKRGESWAEIIKSVFDMTGPELAQAGGPFASALKRLPADVTIRKQVIMACAYGLLNEPNPRLLIALMDRADGRLPQPVSVGGDATLGPVRIVVEYIEGEEAEASPDAAASQE